MPVRIQWVCSMELSPAYSNEYSYLGPQGGWADVGGAPTRRESINLLAVPPGEDLAALPPFILGCLNTMTPVNR